MSALIPKADIKLAIQPPGRVIVAAVRGPPVAEVWARPSQLRPHSRGSFRAQMTRRILCFVLDNCDRHSLTAHPRPSFAMCKTQIRADKKDSLTCVPSQVGSEVPRFAAGGGEELSLLSSGAS